MMSHSILPRVPLATAGRLRACGIKLSPFIVEPQVLTALKQVMMDSSTIVGELFNGLHVSSNAHGDEEEVFQHELEEGGQENGGHATNAHPRNLTATKSHLGPGKNWA